MAEYEAIPCLLSMKAELQQPTRPDADLRTDPQPDPQRPPRWGADRRLEFIDWRLRWEGRINRSDLTAFFGISVPQASLDMGRYQDLAAGNAVYDRRARTYIAGESFTPLYPGNDAGRYLTELLALATKVLPSELSFSGWSPPTGQVPSAGRTVPVEVLVPVLTAVREGRQLTLLYQSMAAEAPMSRQVSPHALAFDGFRWHLRAWCHRREAFRDFGLARMLTARVGESAMAGADRDLAWQRLVPLVLGPNPALSPAAQRVIELDYGMETGKVTSVAARPCSSTA